MVSRAVLFASLAVVALVSVVVMHALDNPVNGWGQPVAAVKTLLHIGPPPSDPNVPDRYAVDAAAMVTPLDLGVPEYPRAIRTTSARTQKGSRTTAEASYLSPDGPQRVLAFYKEKIGKEPGYEVEPKADRTLVSLAKGSEAFTLINIIPDPNHPGGTFLSIEHTPAPFPAVAPQP
ncbi:hypothetical protein [Terriglobus sp.]|uniref:hypothetical protein n=1 Tax=Terriglobus sp. TaxID=1889013 RepID=UPI003B008E9A